MGVHQSFVSVLATSITLLLIVGTFFSYQDHVNTNRRFDQLHAEIRAMSHGTRPTLGQNAVEDTRGGSRCSDPSMVTEYLKKFGGKLPLQPNIKSVTIDIGQADTPITPKADSHFVIGFEPIPTQYRGNQDKYGSLPNMLNMPFGAGDCDSWVHFNENNFKDTSSFLEVNQKAVTQRLEVLDKNNYGDREGNKESFKAHYNYLVPVVQLRHVVNLIPENVELAFIKLDAQGFEGKCLVGLGDTIKRAARVMVEVTVTKEQFYIGSWTKQEVVDHMQKMGFKLNQEEENAFGEEQNLYFDRV